MNNWHGIIKLTKSKLKGDDSMIKFVVYEDYKVFRKEIAMSIDKVMINNELEYEIAAFEKCNKELEQLIESDLSSKIYILDIEIENSTSGIDIARKIRQKDWNSIIIMVTSHSDLTYEVLKAQIMVLDFISKYDNCKENLEKALKLAIEKIDNKKVVVFEISNISHRIYLDDIVYIEKDTVDRKCIIKTTYNEIVVNKSMTEMIDMLDDRFFLSHRSCLINLEKIESVDWTNGIIYFQNGYSVDLLSRDKKKELKEYVGVD